MPDQTAGTPVIVKYIDFFPIAIIKFEKKNPGMTVKEFMEWFPGKVCLPASTEPEKYNFWLRKNERNWVSKKISTEFMKSFLDSF